MPLGQIVEQRRVLLGFGGAVASKSRRETRAAGTICGMRGRERCAERRWRLQLAEPLVAVGTADGDETKKIQERLTTLGFWVGDIDGLYGKATKQSVMAFQKYVGIEATGEVDDATATALHDITERGHAEKVSVLAGDMFSEALPLALNCCDLSIASAGDMASPVATIAGASPSTTPT